MTLPLLLAASRRQVMNAGHHVASDWLRIRQEREEPYNLLLTLLRLWKPRHGLHLLVKSRLRWECALDCNLTAVEKNARMW